MKRFLITIFLITYCFFCYAQQLHISLSTPQPRLGESFRISIDIDTLNKTFFSFLKNKFTLSPVRNECQENPNIGVEATATKLGRNEIGPLTLELNGKKFTTDKIIFDVTDSLPAVNQGFWIRKIKVSDSVYLLLIDQRIPALTYNTATSTSITMTTKTGDDESEPAQLLMFNNNLSYLGSHGTNGYKSIYLPTRTLKFKYSFWAYTLTIKDKTKSVV
jgi:hypothetical protein